MSAITRPNTEPAVLLRESLSSDKTPFAKLVRHVRTNPSAKDIDLESAQPRRGEVEPHRMNRKLSPNELSELVALYDAGASMLELAKKFECHRHTVMRHLQRAGVDVRPQIKMTPELLAQAAALYVNGHPLVEVGRLLGLEASTVGKALKRSGVSMRRPVADRWSKSE